MVYATAGAILPMGWIDGDQAGVIPPSGMGPPHMKNKGMIFALIIYADFNRMIERRGRNRLPMRHDARYVSGRASSLM